MSALSAIYAQLDRMARGRQLSKSIFSTGAFWTLVDAAQDQTYEDIVKGQSITDLDADLASGIKWGTSVLRTWFTLHGTWARGEGYSNLYEALQALSGARIPYEAAQCYRDALSSSVAAQMIFPRGTLVSDETDPTDTDMHLFGVYETGVINSDDGEGALSMPGAILAIGMGSSQTVGATFRCYNFVAPTTYKDLALSLSGADQYTQKVLGETAVASGVSAGDGSIQLASTAAFTAGEWALVVEGTTQELVKVASLGTGPTRLVLNGVTINAFTTSAVVWPLFSNVTYQSGASGSGIVNLYARPDRVISL